MSGKYPYTVQICGHIEFEYSEDGTAQTSGGCEIPAEFLPDLLALLRRINEMYPNLS